jgi:hypothetical protein
LVRKWSVLPDRAPHLETAQDRPLRGAPAAFGDTVVPVGMQVSGRAG